MNIRNKLLLNFTLVTGLSVIALAFIAINNSTRTIQMEVENALNGIVDEKLDRIYSYVDEKQNAMAGLAEIPVVIDAIEQMRSGFSQGINSSAYLALDKKVRPALVKLSEQFFGYDLFLISPEGDIVFSLLHEEEFATNLKTGPYNNTQLANVFIKASTLLETHFSPFERYLPSKGSELDQTPDTAVVRYAFLSTPVFAKHKLLGVLAIQVSNDDFTPIITDYGGLKRTGEILINLLENNDAVVMSPFRHKRNTSSGLHLPIGSKTALPIQSSVMGGKGSGLSIGYEGTKILAAWRHIPELQLGIVAKIDAAEAFASADKLKQNLIFVGLAIVLVTAAIVIFFSHRISAPIIHLSEATKKITSGDLFQYIEKTSSDEIGGLAQAFNEMSDNLRSMISDLEQSNQALEQSNKDLDNFAYVASHDLKSPLRGIDQLATWIREDIDDKDETTEHLRMMRIRINRMEQLLDDLLTYSRVGRIEEKIQRIDSKIVLEELYQLASPPEDYKFELKGVFPVFDTVFVPFQLVFRNLISNAIKHHDRSNGKITISVEENGDFFTFRVMDDGPGIAGEYHEKIFELFQTLKSRDEVEGSGMGLAIIKKTVQVYGCDISVQSEQGQGACFIVVWPKKINI